MSRLRLGFLGVGWIGRSRMAAMLDTGLAAAIAIVEPDPAMREAALSLAPEAEAVDTLDDLLARDLDGIVIATPSALHAPQAIAALESGTAVFCQKPLGRNATEVAAVVAAARKADRLLGLDLSYRHSAAVEAILPLIASGRLGRVHAVDLVFHNAYGPDKAWFYDRALSGGGCLIDLGVHLIDLALWLLGWPEVRDVTAALSAHGSPVSAMDEQVEDFALATLRVAGGAVVRLACSWRLPAGQDAVIGASFYGTDGAAVLHNVGGSFYDLQAEHCLGTYRTTLAAPPDDWGGRAAVEWVRRLASSKCFRQEAEDYCVAAAAIDRIYDAASVEAPSSVG